MQPELPSSQDKIANHFDKICDTKWDPIEDLEMDITQDLYWDKILHRTRPPAMKTSIPLRFEMIYSELRQDYLTVACKDFSLSCLYGSIGLKCFICSLSVAHARL